VVVRILICILALTVLAGCGQSNDASLAVSDGNGGTAQIEAAGENVTITNAKGVKSELTSNGSLPAGFAQYPGSTTVNVSTMSSNGSSTTSASFTTPDEPKKVVAFYKAAFKAANKPISLESEQGDRAMIVTGDGDNPNPMASDNSTVVSANRADAMTEISVIVTKKAQ
jgi:hypothetical protein